ncbi:MAG: molybdopterin cofactor-binding domain-containing protein, partial [Bacteroidota bacterium]
LTEFGAAVVADNTWRAKNAALALDLKEDNKGNEKISTEGIRKEMQKVLGQKPLAVAEEEGNTEEVLEKNADKVIEATYEVPYLAHATMEPMNCTVLVNDEEVQVWVGHQGSSIVQEAVSEIIKVDKAQVTVNTTYLGGGFGRRGEKDFVKKAALVANEMKGTPVMTVFTREEDMRNDMYRPTATSRFKAVVKEDGTIEAWDNMMALQSVSNSAMKRLVPSMAPKPEDDTATTEGARELPYEMENRKVAFGNLELPVLIGFWRSVGSSQNAFFTECFMDECAAAVNMDPYEFRRKKLDKAPRFQKVLDKVAEISHWKKPREENKFRGIALHKSFGSIVGEVAEITKISDKEFSIDKYYCAVDCGIYIHPDTVKGQMAGGIIYALSAALYGEITLKDGKVQQNNFPQYEMVRMPVAPEVEVHIMENDEYPSGVGEPGTPPAAPALVNALFAATGKIERVLPLNKQGYKFV